MKYRKKPVVIEAMQFTGLASLNRMSNAWQKSFLDVADFDDLEEKENFFIETLEGQHCANLNDYIIKGIKGEFYPCKPDIFEMTYEKVESIQGERNHIEYKSCWCEPTLIQAIDDEHDCEVWSHKGHEELNQ